MVSPYERSDPHFQSDNSSLQFYWRGMDDPSVTQVQYRFLHESQVKRLSVCLCVTGETIILSVFLPLCICASQVKHVSVCSSVYLSLCQCVTAETFISLSVCLPLSLSIRHRLNVYQSVRLSASVCLCVTSETLISLPLCLLVCLCVKTQQVGHNIRQRKVRKAERKYQWTYQPLVNHPNRDDCQRS